MRICRLLLPLLLAAGLHAGDYSADPGPHTVTIIDRDWRDTGRQRDVPARLYLPSGEGPFPIVIVSHGLGGTRQGYAYLGTFWASHGYVCVHLQHIGSDNAVWQGQGVNALSQMRVAAADPRNALARPLDIRFAIDTLEAANRDDEPLKGRLDLARIGVAGHSFGAYTALAAAGQLFVTPRGTDVTMGDARVKAAIAMSAPVSPAMKRHLDKAYGAIRIPVFHLTSTKDTSIINDTQPDDRRLPFDHTTHAPAYLLTFDGGNHMLFAGPIAGRSPNQRHLDLIRMGTLAFWDATLRNDAAAHTWFTAGGYAKAIGNAGTLEIRQPKAE